MVLRASWTFGSSWLGPPLHEQDLRLPGNNGQRIMDLVSDPGSQFLDGVELRLLDPLGLGILELKIKLPQSFDDQSIVETGADRAREFRKK